MPLLRRSYEKPENMLYGNFICRKNHPGYIDSNPFGSGYDVEKSCRGISKRYKSVLAKSINENKKLEELRLKAYDEMLRKHREKIRQKIDLNQWKIVKSKPEFDVRPIEKVVLYKKLRIDKPKFMQKPFRRPKEINDYFDKKLHLLGMEKYENV